MRRYIGRVGASAGDIYSCGSGVDSHACCNRHGGGNSSGGGRESIATGGRNYSEAGIATTEAFSLGPPAATRAAASAGATAVSASATARATTMSIADAIVIDGSDGSSDVHSDVHSDGEDESALSLQARLKRR
eukprot:1887821-Pleurochrysis_carterae.AAC.1